VYEWVASRASDELGYDVSVDQVKWWIKQCKEAQLLSAYELRLRKRRATAPDEGQKPATAKRTPRPRKKNT
jgi:hypothetical protein